MVSTYRANKIKRPLSIPSTDISNPPTVSALQAAEEVDQDRRALAFAKELGHLLVKHKIKMLAADGPEDLISTGALIITASSQASEYNKDFVYLLTHVLGGNVMVVKMTHEYLP